MKHENEQIYLLFASLWIFDLKTIFKIKMQRQIAKLLSKMYDMSIGFFGHY